MRVITSNFDGSDGPAMAERFRSSIVGGLRPVSNPLSVRLPPLSQPARSATASTATPQASRSRLTFKTAIDPPDETRLSAGPRMSSESRRHVEEYAFDAVFLERESIEIEIRDLKLQVLVQPVITRHLEPFVAGAGPEIRVGERRQRRIVVDVAIGEPELERIDVAAELAGIETDRRPPTVLIAADAHVVNVLAVDE